ncbi:MAG: endolytic transglycosylase MltG [Clostridia bacterium]|nr:endolytic transglycosylase MltG [Clostridia bacterium]
MKKKILAIVLSIVAVILAAVIGVSAFFISDMNGGKNGKDIQVEIKQGTYTAQIAEILKDNGVISSPLGFRVFAKLKKYESKFKYGHYTFNTGDSYEEIAEKLITQGAKAATIKVTIPEGTGINDFVKNVNGKKVTVLGIASILEKAGVCQKADFISALNEVTLEGQLLNEANNKNTYYALEGYLFPETYEFYKIDDSKAAAKAVIEKMLSEAESRISDDMFKKAESMGYSMHEIMTMASIIQMEAGNDSDALPKIAGVFYNRLNSPDFTTLGSSPTIFYGDTFEQDDDRYDTYKIKGLPPGPLCSPGIKAIKAALNPEGSDYFYFVTDKNGKFYFHKTYAEQTSTINKLKNDGNWIYEYYNK